MSDPRLPEGGASARFAAVPAPLLVLTAAGSVQFGAGIAKSLFDEVGPGGTVLLRTAFAALVLWAIWRPSTKGRSGGEWALIAAFGLSLGAMNLTFYEALDRIPLGVAVTLEFIGPLAVAIAGSRRILDVVWVTLAAGGIVLLTDLGGSGMDALGVCLALVAGFFWGTYIVLGARLGEAFAGGGALALGMGFATLTVLPAGLIEGGSDLLMPELLAVGFVVAMLSSAIPYSLELESLRRLPQRVFGVLMSLEPALATIVGLVVLGEVLGLRELVGIVLVIVASAGAARRSSAPPLRD